MSLHRSGTFTPPAVIYCTDTSHAQYPSFAAGYQFTRASAHDVVVGGTTTKYGYLLATTGTPSGFPNHVIHLDTTSNTWMDGNASNEPDPIEHVSGAYWIRWRHASQSDPIWYYFEDKSSWYSAASGGGQTHGSGTSQPSTNKKVFHNFW